MKNDNGRTDNQVLDAEPVKKQLGDRTFELKPQAHSKGRAFRKEYEELQERIETTRSITATDELIDLIYGYDKGLAEEREWIEDNATDEQLVEVFTVIYELATGPFVESLPRKIAKVHGIDEATLMKLIAKEVEKPLSSKSQ